MAITKEKKQEIVKQLTESFKKAKSVVFADSEGLNVKDFSDMRQKLNDEEVKYKIAKKTLIRIAVKEAGLEEIPEEILSGQTGLAFSDTDEIIAAKTLYEFSKNNENIKLLGALMDGNILSQANTLELAKIPSKDELLARLVGSINAPVNGFYSTLHSLLRSFVGTLSAYAEKAEK